MGKRRSALWLIAGLLLAALAGLAAYKIWPLINPEISERAPLDPDCDLRAGPCSVTFNNGGTVSFGVEPRDIPVVKPLEFDVLLKGFEASSVEVDFQGTDMNMGYNRVKLKQAGTGRFVGNGMLPVCVRYAMEWEAKVLLLTDRGLLAAPFRFITVTPGMEPPER